MLSHRRYWKDLDFMLSAMGSPGRFLAGDMIWLYLKVLFLLLWRRVGVEIGRPGKMMTCPRVAGGKKWSNSGYIMMSDVQRSCYWMGYEH